MFIHGVECSEGVREDEEDDCEGEVDRVFPEGVVQDILELCLKLMQKLSHWTESEYDQGESKSYEGY